MVNDNGMRTMLGVADPWVLKGDVKKRVEFYEDYRRIYCVDKGGHKPFQPPPVTPSPIPIIKPKPRKKVARDLKVFYKQKVSPNQFRSFPEAKQYPRKLLHQPIKWRCEAKAKKIVKPMETTLGSPVGLLNSSFSMRIIQKKKHNYKLQGLATCIIAYGQHFITPEEEWDTALINNVLMEGQKLYERSFIERNDNDNNDADANADADANNADDTKTINYDSDGESVSDEEIDGERKRKKQYIPENQLQRVYKLCGTSIQYDMSEVIAFGLIGSKTIDCDHRIPLLEFELKHFFRTYQTAALIKVNGWQIIVWKCDRVYFVFDCYGRNIQNMASNRTSDGFATLLCLRELENVVHLFMNLSEFSANDFFSLRLIKIVQLLPCGTLPMKLAKKQLRQNDYQIIDDDYAILCGTKNFGPFCHFGKLYRHSLVVALSALLYSKCDPPASWTSRIIDQIFCIGNALYKKWSKSIVDCDHSIDFNIKDIPSHIVFGQFIIHLTILERKYVGHWECTPNYHQSELCQKMKTAFGEGHQNLIVTIHTKHYAIWRKGDFYYFFDPNKHTGCMDFYPTNKTRKLTSSIQLRICRNLNVLFCVFTQVIMNMHLACTFQIDVVRVIEIQRYYPDYVEDWCVKETDDCSNRTEPESLSESIEWKPDDFEFNELSDREAGGDDYDNDDDGDNDDDFGLKKSPSIVQTVPTHDEKKLTEFDHAAAAAAVAFANDGEKGFYDKFNLDSPGNSDAELELIDDHAIERFVKICDTLQPVLCGCDDGDGDGDAAGAHDIDEIVLEEEEAPPGGGDEEKGKGGDVDDGDDGPSGRGGGRGRRGGRGDNDDDDDGGGGGGRGGGGKGKRGRKGSKGGKGGDYDPNDDDLCGCNSDVYPDTDHYPGALAEPRDLVVVGSETGSYNSLCKLITIGFKCTDRILLMTPWRNFALFQATANFESYFVFDGCTCQVEKFRFLDLRCGTAGFLHFKEIHSLIEYLRNSRKNSCSNEKRKLHNIDGICATYCGE